MKLARYWTRQPGEAVGPNGRQIRVVSRGWSNESLEAARASAHDMAMRLAQRIASGLGERRQYLYGDRPLPEPVLRQFPDGAAVLTRNVYGALVLNTRNLMFVDIDREEPPAAPVGGGDFLSGLMSLFGHPAAAPPLPPPGNPVVDGIRRVGESKRLAGRIYRTAAGYRVLITSARFDAAAPESEALLRQFDSDPLYIRLCRGQQSFRARLTPKPWRCGYHMPPVRFPFETPSEETRFRDWEERYDSKSAAYATCRHVADFGDARMDPAFAELVRYHDEATKASIGLPLA